MSTQDQISRLGTEADDSRYSDLDTLGSLELVQAIAGSNAQAVAAVQAEAESIAKVVDLVADRLSRGGRLFYGGAGTSGRLGVLDASECPPTFGLSADTVQGIMAGGTSAIIHPSEGAEDDATLGRQALAERNPGAEDVVIAIAASGRTPWCIGLLEQAKEAGAATVALCCNKGSVLSQVADLAIEINTGPEVLRGSTRLKAGTAQKIALNAISTAVMVRIGKVYKNRMVDMIASNEKLRQRARTMVAELASLPSEAAAEVFLKQADGSIKAAVTMAITGVSADEANNALAEANGFLRKALQRLQ